MRIVKLSFALLVVCLFGGVIWLSLAPPELLRVGSGYAAKIVCSNVFLAHRDANQVLETDVQAPGNPLLKLIRVTVDEPGRRVEAGFFGFIARREAAYRDGLGCAVLPDDSPRGEGRGDRRPVVELHDTAAQAPVDHAALWPEGGRIETDAGVMQVLSDERLAGPGMRAILVIKDGRIVGERYGKGFDPGTPLLGWSMTKTVTAALVATLIKRGDMTLDDRSLLPEWANDRRRDISLRDLLSMQSGLAFNEDYGDVADVTRMLYLVGDMARFAGSLPLEADPGSAFHYSTGTSLILSKIWMEQMGNTADATAYPRQALFNPLGMRSAVLEEDASGVYAGGSYLYATARDWGRFALMLARKGNWNGSQVMAPEFVDLMLTANGHSDGRYSQAQTWLPRREGKGIPAGTFNLQGHDGQTIAVNPSAGLVVLRMGLTPSRERYDPGLLVGAVAKATGVGP